jgi:hypothetical protein
MSLLDCVAVVLALSCVVASIVASFVLHPVNVKSAISVLDSTIVFIVRAFVEIPTIVSEEILN